MLIEVIQTPDCPHARSMIEVIERLADDRPDWEFHVRVLGWDSRPPPGFSGSPTLLVNGQNPFDTPAVEAPACALHPPSAEQVVGALMG
jgi:hypothetical protein